MAQPVHAGKRQPRAAGAGATSGVRGDSVDGVEKRPGILAGAVAFAGAVSRFNMGLVIASGLSIGTLFTLFVVPAVYMMIAADHSRRTNLEEAAEPA